MGADLEQSRAVFRRAVDAGINFIDTCDYYSSGRERGDRRYAVAEHGNRGEFVLATKVGNPMGRDANARGYSRKHIIEAAEDSLRRLGPTTSTSTRPISGIRHTNSDEMVEAFDHLVRGGKVLYVGITDMPFWQFATAYFHAERRGLARFISMQNHYNLLWREDERELLPFCRAQGIGLIPYSPMARGFLCGRARRQEAARKPSAPKPTTTPTSCMDGRPTKRWWIVSRRSRPARRSRDRLRSHGCCTSPASPRPSSARRSPIMSMKRWRRSRCN